jgi:hypothetical protein
MTTSHIQRSEVIAHNCWLGEYILDIEQQLALTFISVEILSKVTNLMYTDLIMCTASSRFDWLCHLLAVDQKRNTPQRNHTGEIVFVNFQHCVLSVRSASKQSRDEFMNYNKILIYSLMRCWRTYALTWDAYLLFSAVVCISVQLLRSWQRYQRLCDIHWTKEPSRRLSAWAVWSGTPFAACCTAFTTSFYTLLLPKT